MLNFSLKKTVFLFLYIQGEKIKYVGDPLQDFTLIRFLDRFVYKNPKKKEQGKFLSNETFMGRQADTSFFHCLSLAL